ncbi:MAG: Rieske 2Fe-2S domain-containing protein [Chloroflexi bacterium]|nr:Rieske 2Fe-2S domain-containing protein [Chloroflexota bacterium]MCL5075155.1 Rieske 2Fe-2S domain-containing protein [Chloroflexota bacterium]
MPNNNLASGDGKPGTTRRNFLRMALGFSILATLAGLLAPIISFLWPPVRAAGSQGARVLVGTLSELPIGKAKVIPVANKPVIVIHLASGMKGFSAICTHLGCIVKWDESRQVIHCPCHDGLFNPLNGSVISGPPPSPLPSVSVSVEGDKIFAGGA